MQVILKQNIRNLGRLGEVVAVKPGYARNFLIPQSKAMQATAANMKVFEARRAELEKHAEAELAQAKARAEKLQGLSIVIVATAGEGGKLFGSIGTRDVAEQITVLGEHIARGEVRLPQGVIRQIGEYEVVLHLHNDVEVKTKVTVNAG